MENKKPVSQEQFGREWAEGTVKAFLDAMNEEGVQLNELYKSFLYNVLMASGGNMSLIQLRMKFTARLTDMGVGRGTTAGARTSVTKKGRRPTTGGRRKKKPIYNKPLTGRIKFLRTALAEDYKINAISILDTLLKQQPVEIKI